MSSYEMPAELLSRWVEHLLQRRREDATQLYFDEIATPLIAALAEVEEHRALRERRFHTLVSLMGFSPETTVLSTALIRPERLIVIHSRKSKPSYGQMMRYFLDHDIIDSADVIPVVVDPADYQVIYERVAEAIDQVDLAKGCVVDVTGGKKVMSATAGAASWRLGVPLSYVDSDSYDPDLRRPVPGRERIILLENPHDYKLAEIRKEALLLYEQGHYSQAATAFAKSRDIRVDRDLETVAIELCACYVALADLRLDDLAECVGRLHEVVSRPIVQATFGSRLRTDAHVSALTAVASGEPVAFVAACLHLARLYADQGRSDFSSLLAYRSMEAIVTFGLQRFAPTFDPTRPDYSLLGDEEELREGFAAIAANPKQLPYRVALLAGVSLLCLTTGLHERAPYERSINSVVGELRGVASTRNQSVLAHGSRVLSRDDSDRIANAASDLAAAVLDAADRERLSSLRENLERVDLGALAPM